MPTELLSAGPTHDMIANQVYALPGLACWIQSLAAIQTSIDGTTWSADIPASITPGVVSAAAFVRSTTADNKIILKNV